VRFALVEGGAEGPGPAAGVVVEVGDDGAANGQGRRRHGGVGEVGPRFEVGEERAVAETVGARGQGGGARRGLYHPRPGAHRRAHESGYSPRPHRERLRSPPGPVRRAPGDPRPDGGRHRPGLPPPLPHGRRDFCVTEFVNVEGLLRGLPHGEAQAASRRRRQPTVIQIYGSDPERLAEAGVVAERAGPRPSTSTAAAGCPRSPAAARARAGCATRRDGGDGEDGGRARGAARDGEDPHRVGPRERHAHRRPRASPRRRRRAGAHGALPHRADGPRRRGRLGLGPQGPRGGVHPRGGQRRHQAAPTTRAAPSPRRAARA
jgi:hypothetical protein